MALDCTCDYDPPDVYWSKMVRAKKPYRCYECSAPIAVGERHEYAFGVIYGDSYQPRTCADCTDIRRFVQNNIPCWCWAHGNMLEDAHNIIREAYAQAADEVRGVAFGFGRLLVKQRRKRAEMMRAA
jgi:hypothetical protein